MQLKTKKIIAREGLVIIGILLISGLLITIGNHTPIRTHSTPTAKENTYTPAQLKAMGAIRLDDLLKDAQTNKTTVDNDILSGLDLSDLDTQDTPKQKLKFTLIKDSGIFLLFFGYPFYWIIRFILWAIRTLKQKEA